MSTDDIPIAHRIFAGVSADGTTLEGAPLSNFAVLLLGPQQPLSGEYKPVAVGLRLHFVGPDENLPLTVPFDLSQIRRLYEILGDTIALLDSYSE